MSSKKYIRFRRSSRDSVCVNKRKYLQEYNHVLDIEDESIFEFIKVKKNKKMEL